MKKCAIRAGLLAAAVAGVWGWTCGRVWAQGFGPDSDSLSGGTTGKRPMTFADLQRMKRVSDPQVSPSGRWVMFSAMDVDLEKNTKVNHLWVVPMAAVPADGQGKADSSAALRNDNLKNGSERQADSSAALRNENKKGGPDGPVKSRAERQLTFWKEGESGGRFSPDGKQVAFVATDSATGLSQIFLAAWDDAAGTLGTPKRLTGVSTEADGAVWSPNSQRILFVSRVYPECSDEASWMDEDLCNKKKDDRAAANPVKAQVFEHLMYRHWNSYLGPKRSHVLVVSAADGNAVRDLTPRGDIGDAEAPTFTLGGPVGYAWAPGSEEIAYVTNVDLVPAASTNNDVFTLLLDDAGARPRKVSASMGSDDAPAYSPDGKYLAFRSQARAAYESDRFRLMLFDRLAGTTKELLPKLDRWVDEFVWNPVNPEICFTSADHGEERIFCTYPNLGDSLFALPGKGEYGELQFAALKDVGYELVATKMTVESPAAVVALFRGDVKASADRDIPSVSNQIATTEVRLTHLNDDLEQHLDLPKMTSFTFSGAEGAPVQGFMIPPPKFDAAKKYPLKFLIHGGPQGAWGDAWSYRWNAELMAASGYVVVMVNPRGSTGYGQAFVDGVNGDWGGKPYVDLMKGLDFAESKFAFIDKTRECALGASYGGFMANWILTHTDRFACIVTHDGMFNPESAYGTTEELWFNEWEFRRPGEVAPGQPWRYAAGPVANDPFRRWSPMLAIQSAKTPTLVVHSQRDYRLDVSEGFQLFTALQRLNVPSKMLYFPDEGHWVLKPQNSKLWYETVGDWCDKWTKTNLYAAVAPSTTTPASKAGTKVKGAAHPAAPVAASPAAATASPVGVPAGPSVEDSSQRAGGSEDFTVAIGAPQDEVKVGSDARVTIALRNVSDHQVAFAHRPGANNAEFSYRIEVKDAAGRAVGLTAYGREALQHQEEESRTVEFVQPGKAAVQTAHLEKLVNINRPGRYTVQVFRKDAKSGAVVRSNELTLNVVP
ncbi:alpha/beta hydrolase family protein [Tunturiibacter gelidoferens]|uniref:Dipeptidyl aminopeptidase/acylaminoacyl peptidase n=1 Tax=Tunturiibacter gelidiferens TaxID=3069689 RepID=A0ACC5P067_9BACT|nr:S9 family peptidase [Edaphobacter lichenicola]MBB5340195.1 dipeptidyl aminopeptidase/acylaminoacyl peptidase [Edaphobacter lichenicola]